MSGKRRALIDPSVVEAYIRGGVTPRYMQRLMDIEAAVVEHRRRLGFLYEDLHGACANDPQAFEERWRALARRWSFDRVNELIAQHNEYYPDRAQPADRPAHRRVPDGERALLSSRATGL